MHPFYPVFWTLTATSLVVKAYDDGKTRTPPANVVSAMLNATITSSTVGGPAMTNAITGEIYRTRLGEHVLPTKK
jgi:hypothetical protein